MGAQTPTKRVEKKKRVKTQNKRPRTLQGPLKMKKGKRVPNPRVNPYRIPGPH